MSFRLNELLVVYTGGSIIMFLKHFYVAKMAIQTLPMHNLFICKLCKLVYFIRGDLHYINSKVEHQSVFLHVYVYT